MPIYAPHPALPVPCKIRPLAADRVRFVGEAVAVVIADDVYRAYDALDLIRVEYEPLPAVVDVEAALAPGAPDPARGDRRQRGGGVAPARGRRGGRAARRAGGGAHPHPAGPRRRAPARAARARRRVARRPADHPRRGADGPPAPRGDRGPARAAARIRCASSRRPTSAAASAPRACTTPSTSWWPSWPAASTGRSSGSRRGASTRWWPAWSATRCTTWRSRPPATARCSPSRTTSSTRWGPTPSPASTCRRTR